MKFCLKMKINRFLFCSFKEVDEDEFDQRRSICLGEMKELEMQFAKLKEELISEKYALIDEKLRAIEDETADEFKLPLQKLQMNKDFKIKHASNYFTETASFQIQTF